MKAQHLYMVLVGGASGDIENFRIIEVHKISNRWEGKFRKWVTNEKAWIGCVSAGGASENTENLKSRNS